MQKFVLLLLRFDMLQLIYLILLFQLQTFVLILRVTDLMNVPQQPLQVVQYLNIVFVLQELVIVLLVLNTHDAISLRLLVRLLKR